MNLENLTDDDLISWRSNHVTEIVNECLWKVHNAQKEQCLEAYWAGSPWTEAELLALRRMESMIDDMFGSTADDLRAVMEQIDGNDQTGHSSD